jgi:hypothetical protein
VVHAEEVQTPVIREVATEAEFMEALSEVSVDIIRLTDRVTLSRSEDGRDNLFVISRPMTIQGGELVLERAGIILGADVTFENTSIYFSNSVRNAIIANGDVAKWVLGYANSRKDSKAEGKITITGYVLPKATWNTLCLDALHMAVEKKTFEIIYGDPEEKVAEKVEAKTKAKAEPEATK